MFFLDVAEQAYGFNAIQFVSQTNLMGGYPDGTFLPQATVAWGELCQILALFMENGAEPRPQGEKPSAQWQTHWAADTIAYCRERGVLDPESVELIDFDKSVLWKDAYALLLRSKRSKNLLVIPEERRQSSPVEITRADLAQLLYRTCELTGRGIAGAIFRLNKRNRWGQSLRLLFQYALCVHFVDSDISFIFRLICENPARDATQDALCYETMAKILKRKSLFRHKEAEAELYHYTSLSAMEKLTRKGAKFRLSNVAYLNDPMEGHLFIKHMKNCFDGEQFSGWSYLRRERGLVPVSDSFVASFTDSAEEQLPMWVQYGDDGQGCRIGIRPKSLKAPLYSIVYDAHTLSQFLDSVRGALKTYLERVGTVNMDTDIVFHYAASVLTQVSYLCKDAHYEHEREMRILLFSDLASAKVEGKIREGEVFPRLFIELEDEVEISSITLGPKTAGAEKIAVGLASRGYDVKMLQTSEISYR